MSYTVHFHTYLRLRGVITMLKVSRTLYLSKYPAYVHACSGSRIHSRKLIYKDCVTNSMMLVYILIC